MDRADTRMRMAGRHATLPRASLLVRLGAGGTEGNERLTVQSGVVLIVLLAVLGVTILRIGQLLSVHLFVGLLLLGPVALKLASTGYRFLRYYTHEPRYRRKGPPAPALRWLAPLVVLTTVVVFASGVALLLLGPSSRSSLLLVHKASFFVWLGATAIHVLGHLPDIQQTFAGSGELRDAVFSNARGAGHAHEPAARAGSAGRALALAGALVAGLVLAVALIPRYGPWLSHHRVFLH
jgi:hypothetical protein